MAETLDNSANVLALLRVCSLLNRYEANYLVIGGYACILHGMVRTTEDVDILIEESAANYQRIIDALSELEDHAARELTLQDFEENVVIKVADEVEVDVSRRAWSVTYSEAIPHAQKREISGITVPYLSLRDLIASKGTYRDQDQVDVARLRILAERKDGK
ncbi:MAG: nucleotidyltransferase [bacterium]|jgi:hypothetical protein